MAHNCKNCKFYDTGKNKTCRKGHKLLLHLPFSCPYSKEKERKPYFEQFTECDKCKYLEECKSEGYVIYCSNCTDDYEHYMRGINAYCKKIHEPFEAKKLSEIIDMEDKTNNPSRKEKIKILQKAIEMFGDITYEEFIKDKIVEVFDELRRN